MDAEWRLRIVEAQLELMTHSRKMIDRAIRDARRSIIMDNILAGVYAVIGVFYLFTVLIGANSGTYLVSAAIWFALGGLFFWLGRRQIPVRARALEARKELEEEMDHIILDHTRLTEELKKEDNDA